MSCFVISVSEKEGADMKIFCSMTLVVLAMLPFGAVAQSRTDAMSAVLRCTGINDNMARLACYDKAAGQTRAALASPEAVAPPPAAQQSPSDDGGRERGPNLFEKALGIAPERPAQTTVAQFGSETLTSNIPQPGHIRGDIINAIQARMTNYAFRGGLLTVALDNGQVWQQMPGGQKVGYFSKPALSYTVEITRGSAASYIMAISGIHMELRVLRAK
jgi:hypothetical protein